MVRRVALLLLVSAASLMSCGPDFTGPDGGRLRTGALAINPLLPRASQVSGSLDIVPFVDVRVVLRRSNESVVLDTVVAFPSNVDEISLTLSIPLSPDAPATGEPLSLTMEYRNAAGETVFFAGPVEVVLLPYTPGSPPPIVDVPAAYTGPGSNAASVTISPTTLTTSPNSPLTFTAQALDANSAVLPGTPLYFTTSDATIVDVTLAGVASVKNKRGTVTITAHSLTGQSADATITVQLPASSLSLISGNTQTGAPSTQLAQPVVVRALASDGLGVAGVIVSFAAANGGSVGAASVATDPSGNAQTTWTLGAGTGAQSLTASASGLTGSPITFSATATAGAATQLQFGTQPPANVSAGVPIAGPVTVTARDGSGNLVTSYNGTVTLTLGGGGGGTLLGTTAVAAVNGVATFTDIRVNVASTGRLLDATAPGLQPATSTTFTVAPSAPAVLAFTVQPATSSVGTPIAPPIQVSALDGFGNVATSFTGNVTLTIGTNPGGATLTGTGTVAAVAGVATFANISLNQAGAGYTLNAAATGVTTVGSAPFTIATGANAWTNVAGGLWSTATNWSMGRVPNATDSVVITLPGNYTVTLDGNFNASFITIGGVSGVQSLLASSRTLGVSGVLTINDNGVLELNQSTLNGPGTLANNGGLVSVHGTSAINSAITTIAGSSIRVEGEGGLGAATLTHGVSFTNNGTIELTSVSSTWSATLSSGSSTVTNAPGALFTIQAGAGGPRVISTNLINQGSLNLQFGTSLTTSLTNSGTINVSGGDFALSLTQGGAHFTNSGTVNIGGGLTLVVNNGNFNQNSGPIQGIGQLSLRSTVATFATSFTNVSTGLDISNSSIAGPGSITNAAGRTLTVSQSSFQPNVTVINQGLLVTHGNTVIGGPFTSAGGSTVRIEGESGLGAASLTFNSGFLNNGAVELTSSGSTWGAALNGASMGNGPGATISSLVGAGGPRTIGLALSNQGTITIDQALTLSQANAAHLNSGTINAAGGDFTVLQSAGAFSNAGTISIASGRTWSVSGGTLSQSAGAITGAGTVSLANVQADFATSFTNAVTSLVLSTVTVNGPGTITNAAGRTLVLDQSAFNSNAPLDNQGTLIVHGTSTIHSTFTTSPSSVLRIEGESVRGAAALTVTNGFVNNALVELTSTGSTWGATLLGGTVTNPPAGAIAALAGTGGPRTVNAPLANAGVVNINQPLTLSLPGAQHANSGTINVGGGDFILMQAGTLPSFTNTGSVTIGSGRTWSVTGGTLNQNSGTIGGAGALSLTGMTVNFATNFTNAVTTLALANTTVNGPGTITNAAGRTMVFIAATIASAPFVNDGVLAVNGNSEIHSSLTTAGGSVITIEGESTRGTAMLTVTPGFTNTGAVVLTSSGSTWNAVLNGGTVTNSVGGSILALPGAGGPRTIVATLQNQGTVLIDQPLTISGLGALQTNAGTFHLNGGDLTIAQGGGGFANAGLISINAGNALRITGGTFAHQGAFTGGGNVVLDGVQADFGVAFNNAVTGLALTNTNVGGIGVVTNEAGKTLTLDNARVGLLTNAGVVVVHGTSSVDITYASVLGSTLRVEGESTRGAATLTIANGFANFGGIELTSTGSTWSSTLTIGSGEIAVQPGASLTALEGTGGPRIVNGSLLGLGDITLSPGAAGVLNVNTGTLLMTGKLTVDLGGPAPAQYDLLAVNGSALLGGTLTVNLINGFAPKDGDVYTIMTCESLCTGAFLGQNLPALPNGLTWEINTLEDPKAVRLKVKLGE